MKLKEWNYDLGPSGGFADVDYPDEIIRPFVEFFRNTDLWQNNMDVIVQKHLMLQRALTEHRNRMSEERAEAEKELAAEIDALAEPVGAVSDATGTGDEELGHVMVLDSTDLADSSVSDKAASKIASVIGVAASLSEEEKKAAGLEPYPLA